METQELNPEVIVPQRTENLPEKWAGNGARKENGQFAPGSAGGPGRPKTARIKDAFEGILQDEGAEKYAAVVTNIALNGARSADRLAAVNIIADRTEGKPLQAMLVGHTIDESSVRTIAELLGKLHIPPAIEQDNE